MDTSKNALRTRGRPFAPGNQSGKGRPRGSRNNATILLEKLTSGQAEEIWGSVLLRALNGNDTAMRLFAERAYPVAKGRRLTLAKFPSVASAGGVAAALDMVLNEVATGKISPDEGATLSQILEGRRRVIETQELEIRIAALEVNKE